MAVVTATQVTTLTDISATAAEITASGLIPIVQARIVEICWDRFVSPTIYHKAGMTFDASARTIVADSGSFATEGFADGDEINVYGSHRNDGYYVVSTVSGDTLTLATGQTVVAELSGATILVSLAQWPEALAYPAAQMVAYDYDTRKTRPPGLKSQALGPRSESYNENIGPFGYPQELIDALPRVARLV